MAYVALYRTHRPQTFKDVAGQEHITTTLKNALKNDKVAHAYLFSGPRGTGKTSVAKILAKAVNCELAPINDPCNKCSICIGLNKGTINDVIEIDAASNNSVDEIRDIRDKVKYLPSVCKYKVYIIDEVHMLSTNAFNALLKTLEEPPKHVIFILATTEVHKIPATILSRCQRFDFRAISLKEIFDKIKSIVKKEKILIDDEAIRVIAENAEGGLRDALSLLDQAISYSGKKVSFEDVHKVSGSIAAEKIIELIDNVLEKKSSKALQMLEELLSEGKEIPRIITDIIAFFRNVLVYKNIRENDFQLEIFKKEEFISIAKRISNARIYFLINILNETQSNIKWTNQKREYLEIALIKMCDDFIVKPVEETELLYQMNARLKVLEEKPTIIKQTVIKEKPIKEKVSNGLIEQILHNINNGKKRIMEKGWVGLSRIEDNKIKMVANLLYEGTLVATDDFNMIITYDDEYKCSQIMKKQNKEIIKQILNRKTNLIEDYIAITKEEWQTINNEYNDQKKKGIDKPKVKIAGREKRQEHIPEIERKAYEFFGKDKIKIKEK